MPIGKLLKANLLKASRNDPCVAEIDVVLAGGPDDVVTIGIAPGNLAVERPIQTLERADYPEKGPPEWYCGRWLNEPR